MFVFSFLQFASFSYTCRGEGDFPSMEAHCFKSLYSFIFVQWKAYINVPNLKQSLAVIFYPVICWFLFSQKTGFIFTTIYRYFPVLFFVLRNNSVYRRDFFIFSSLWKFGKYTNSFLLFRFFHVVLWFSGYCGGNSVLEVV